MEKSSPCTKQNCTTLVNCCTITVNCFTILSGWDWLPSTYQNPIDAVVDNFSYDDIFLLHQGLNGFQQAALHLSKGLVLECSHQNAMKEGIKREGRGGERRWMGLHLMVKE